MVESASAEHIRLMRQLRSFLSSGAALLTLAACARPYPGSAVSPVATATPPASAQRTWADSVLAPLTLRERVGQMVMIWMLGDYTSTTDSSYAEVIRWVEQDRIGGVSMSLGTPGEVATKLNDLQ